MKVSSQSKLRKFVYQGDPLVEPPPAELRLLDRHRDDGCADHGAGRNSTPYGYLGQDQLRYVARELGFPIARVYGVATFYNLFLFDPPGEFQVRVCRGTACHVNQSWAS